MQTWLNISFVCVPTEDGGNEIKGTKYTKINQDKDFTTKSRKYTKRG
jgi:hypothetical protein